MIDKPLDCQAISSGVVGKHDYRERPLKPTDIEFMRIMTETTGCSFVDVTPKDAE
jgi:hypothetical protein